MERKERRKKGNIWKANGKQRNGGIEKEKEGEVKKGNMESMNDTEDWRDTGRRKEYKEEEKIR